MKNYGWNAFFEDERLELLETILGSIAAKSRSGGNVLHGATAIA